MKLLTKLIASTLALSILSLPVQAALIDIRIDLGDLDSATSGSWNNIESVDFAATTSLIDFVTGLDTGVSIQGNENWVSFVGASDDFPNKDWIVGSALNDAAGLRNGLEGAFSISGLATGLYMVELVSVRTQFEYLNSFSVNGTSASRTANGTPVPIEWNSNLDGLNAQNWLIWDEVNAFDGSISISNIAENTLGILNAIRISRLDDSDTTLASAPATALLILLSFGALVVRSRKQQA